MIQIVFTPAVQWTFLVGLCYSPRVSKSPADLEINGHPLVSLNGAFVLIALYCTYYIYLDRLFGMAYSVVAAPPLYLFAQVFFASVGRTLAWRDARALPLLSGAMQRGSPEAIAPEISPATICWPSGRKVKEVPMTEISPVPR